MTDNIENVPKVDSVVELACKTALKTLAYALCFIVILTSVLSLALPQSASIYYRLGLYGKALSQSERVLSRRERSLNNFYAGGAEYKSYAQESYLPVLNQTTNYAIKYASVKGNTTNRLNALKYITAFNTNNSIGGLNYNLVVNEANVNSVSGMLKALVYNNQGYLDYHYVLNAMHLGEVAEQNGYYTATEFIRSILANELNEVNSGRTDIFTGLTPTYALNGYLDYYLESIGFNYNADLMSVVQQERRAERDNMFDKSLYSPELLSLFTSKVGNTYVKTSFYQDFIEVYHGLYNVWSSNIETADPLAPFKAGDTLAHKVRAVYYSRVLHNYAYLLNAMFATTAVYYGADNPLAVNQELYDFAITEYHYWSYESGKSLFNQHNSLLNEY